MASNNTRPARMTAYINPADAQHFASVADYTLADGTPAVNVVCLFAGNYAADTPPYLRAQNNNPPTMNPFNDNIQAVLDSGAVGHVQSRGPKVLLTVLNGHQPVGWSEFTREADAMAFAQYLKTVVEQYGLDGIDIDDEYSTGTPNETSLAMVTTCLRQIMPDKIITKALWDDLGCFGATWNGHTLGGNLAFGAEMSYGGDPPGRLEPYLQAGLAKGQLSLGFTAGRGPADPDDAVQWLQAGGYAGAMVYAFEDPANVELMGRIVNAWYGPGNWNAPAVPAVSAK